MDYDYRGGFIEAFSINMKAYKNYSYNAHKYKNSMYYKTSSDPMTLQFFKRIANSYYGISSLDIKNQIVKSRFVLLKAFIRYRLKHYYNKEVTHE